MYYRTKKLKIFNGTKIEIDESTYNNAMKIFSNAKFVETTSSEFDLMWLLYSNKVNSWKTENFSYNFIVDIININDKNHTVNFSFRYSLINNEKYIFYYPTSNYVNYKAVDYFLKENGFITDTKNMIDSNKLYDILISYTDNEFYELWQERNKK